MRPLALGVAGRPLRVLCLGAHPDDIEIGCGGTVLTLLAGEEGAEVHWEVFAAGGTRAAEAERSAAVLLRRARDARVVLQPFRDGYFPADWAAIKDRFEALKHEVEPDVVFTHARDDRHQDHRILSDLAWNTFRRHLILEYEIPKYDGDLARPNLYVPLTPAVARRKVKHLLAAFPSQAGRPWFTASTFEGLMRLRAVEAGLGKAGMAEAFTARKVVAGA